MTPNPTPVAGDAVQAGGSAQSSAVPGAVPASAAPILPPVNVDDLIPLIAAKLMGTNCKRFSIYANGACVVEDKQGMPVVSLLNAEDAIDWLGLNEVIESRFQ